MWFLARYRDESGPDSIYLLHSSGSRKGRFTPREGARVPAGFRDSIDCREFGTEGEVVLVFKDGDGTDVLDAMRFLSRVSRSETSPMHMLGWIIEEVFLAGVASPRRRSRRS